VDGSVVMVENIFRELASREGQPFKVVEVIRAARTMWSGLSSTRWP